MKKRPEFKHRMEVLVIPNPRPEYPSHARVEARVMFPEGKAVFVFAQADSTLRDLAETIAKALEDGSLRDVKFDPGSETNGHLHLMWNGQSHPVGFWVSVEGPEYLYRNAKSALKERVSK
jgi:hypothetical protein